MIPEKTAKLLKYPLYKLHYIEDIASFSGLSENEIHTFRQQYDETLRSDIIQALRWVTNHPDVDLSTVYSGLPFSNKEMHEFIRKLLASLE